MRWATKNASAKNPFLNTGNNHILTNPSMREAKTPQATMRWTLTEVMLMGPSDLSVDIYSVFAIIHLQN